MPRSISSPSDLCNPGVFSEYQAEAYITENISSNPVSSPPADLRPVGRYRSEGLRYQDDVIALMMFRYRIMSTLKARLKTKLLAGSCAPPLLTSMWLPSMSPRPATR